MTHLTSITVLPKQFFVTLCLAVASGYLMAADSIHPNSTVTQAEVDKITAQISTVPSAAQALAALTAKVDARLTQPMIVPFPKDAGGGYTHEQHKRNYRAMYETGLLFQLTKERKYLDYTRSMMLEYAKLYPTLGLHPKKKEQTPGRLFWQSLNEAMWLVYTIQAYDFVAGDLDSKTRETIETDLLRPVANYLSAGQPQTFNKIHNHGTWAAAAVGMTGYVIGDDKLVQQALYGLDMSGKAGFVKQLEWLFSPDGYYTEGPYYQRFALLPFVLFAKAIEVNQPELKIFEHNDSVLLKAIETTVQLSYNKLFFGINDAIKDKGIDTVELVHGVAIAYDITKNPQLLAIAQRQNNTLLTGYGFGVAKAINEGLTEPFEYRSMQLRDGQKGDQGALAIFRNGIEYGHQAVVVKNTAQGLGHGHYDKLHWLLFDNGNEIISDYGAARFLNIEAKYGGHYLPENNQWAKQTIAHNTVVVDEQSHFYGQYKKAKDAAPSIDFFDVDGDVKITSAVIKDAYKDVELRRTMAMVKVEGLEHPLVIDVFKILGENSHQYDLPLHYNGHIMSHSVDYKANTEQLMPLGQANGYQYLWNLGSAELDSGMSQVTWLKDDRFYSYSFASNKGEELIFTKLGANDPNFNLLDKTALVHRVNASDHAFVSVLEPHGEYNGTAEFTLNARSKVAAINTTKGNSTDVVTIELNDGSSVLLGIAYDSSPKKKHKVKHQGQTVKWRGHYTFIKTKK